MRSVFVPLICVSFILVGLSSAASDDKSEVEKELKKLEGKWTFASIEFQGKEEPPHQLERTSATIEGDKYFLKIGDSVFEVAIKNIDPSKSPKTFDAKAEVFPDLVYLCIYEISEDTLKVCYTHGNKRPTEFKTAANSSAVLFVHKRVKK